MIKQVLILLAIVFVGLEIRAQSNTDYLEAMQLMRINQYEQAYELLSGILRENPNNYPVFDNAVMCLVQLKRYDEAINLASRRLRSNYADIVLSTRLGELYHFDGQLDEAYSTWSKALEASKGSLQAYRYIANAMSERREHARANEVYFAARNQFNNESLFFSEITTNFMAQRMYDDAVRTLISVLEFAPGYSAFVQRQIINFDDPQITEIAILELDDASRNTSQSSPQFVAYREIMVGLLMEKQLFRRALTTARGYERLVQNESFPVYSLANRLRSQQQFELADEAYNFYFSQESHPQRARSMEDRAILYIAWSRYLTTNNLDYDQNARELIVRSDQLLLDLLQNYPNYPRRAEVLSLKTEIALDYLKDADKADDYLKMIEGMPNSGPNRIIAEYVTGRIHIFRGSHSLARVALTRANREARTGELAEKTRYFLALNDFYAGDFEFASLQMRSLERLTTSYYANDALRLRLWMQQGVVQEEVTDELKMFSYAKFHFDVGEYNEGIKAMEALMKANNNAPLKADAYLLLASYLRTENPVATYTIVNSLLMSGYRGALREHLLWEKVRIAEGIAQNGLENMNRLQSPQIDSIIVFYSGSQESAESRFYGKTDQNFTVDVIFNQYEDILFEYPQGFYAEAIRARLQELQTEISS